VEVAEKTDSLSSWIVGSMLEATLESGRRTRRRSSPWKWTTATRSRSAMSWCSLCSQVNECHIQSLTRPFPADLYQVTMAYAYWKANRIDDVAVFDLFFRKNPFGGEFTIFAGLEDCMRFLQNFRYSQEGANQAVEMAPNFSLLRFDLLEEHFTAERGERVLRLPPAFDAPGSGSACHQGRDNRIPQVNNNRVNN